MNRIIQTHVLVLAALLARVAPGFAQAQQPNTVGAGGSGGGTVAQGSGGSSPWLVKFDQTSTNATVDVSDRAGRVLGQVTFSSAQAVTQSGSWTVSFGQYTPVSGRLPVDGSGVTQPISAASLPLPSGAATAAKQPALGTAGSASADVVTVQGIASMTALKVDGSAVTQPVSGTFWQATQPVSGPLTDTQLRASAVPVSGTFWQATQPVSGTVTANIGTTNGLALDATLTGGTQQTKLTDGTNIATVKAASTAAGATDKAVVVAVSPNNSVAVTGTFWQATQPVSLASVPTHDVGNITTAITPGTAAANLGKAEDSAHTTGDTGVAILGVRNDGTSTQTTDAAGDHADFAVDAYGAQWSRGDHPNSFTCSLDNIAATLTQCQAAPAAGLRLYLTDIVAMSTTTTAGTFLLRQGTGTNCGTGTASVFPSAATAARVPAAASNSAGGPTVITLKTPIKLTAANALCLLGVATNTTTIQISGFIAP